MPRNHQKSIRLLLAIALFTVIAITAYSYLAGPIFRHRTEIGLAKEAVARVQGISPDDVSEIFIDLNGSNYLVLKAPKDNDDIERVINSLKRIRVANRECWLPLVGTYSGSIVVRGRKPGSGVSFWGHFDPRRAPIISRSMRSSDLSKILYDIFRRRGISPDRTR